MNSVRRNRVRAKLREKQGGKCCYCCQEMFQRGGGVGRVARATGLTKKQVRLRTETIEHLLRLADGGTDRLDNLALCCLECNTGRGSTDWLTYTSLRRGETAA